MSATLSLLYASFVLHNCSTSVCLTISQYAFAGFLLFSVSAAVVSRGSLFCLIEFLGDTSFCSYQLCLSSRVERRINTSLYITKVMADEKIYD
jgi:hypothetical protein